MAAPKYKLIFFNIRAKAEPIRWMFAYAGVPFEDYRIRELPPHRLPDPSARREWNALKPKLPYGVVPVLEVDGEFLGDTHAIARYLAKPLGLAGENDWQAAEADSIITFIISSEFDFPLGEYITEMDTERRKDALARLIGRIPKVAETLEKLLQKNNSSGLGGGFFVGNSPTIADFFSVSFYEIVETYIKPELLSSYKILQEHRQLIRGLPGVKEFIQEHAHILD